MKRPRLLALHRYLGLATGIFFLITAATGGLMIYKADILFAFYPELQAARDVAQQTADPAGAPVLSRLWSERGQSGVRRVRYPDAEWPFYTASYTNGDLAYFSPSGEQLLVTRGYENPITLIFNIHHHWMMGDAGEFASGYTHLAVLVLLLLGIYAWWPRSWGKSLHLVLRGSAVKVTYSWHRVLGAVSSLALIVIVSTGVMMVFYTQVQSVLLATFGGQVQSVSRTIEVGHTVHSWPRIYQTLQSTLPEGHIRIVSFPANPDQALVVRKRMPGEWHQNGRSFIYVNPYTADVYAYNNAMNEGLGMRLTHKIYPLHSGAVGGPLYTLVLLIAAIAPLCLVPTGFYIWWWRRKRRNGAAEAASSR